VPKPLPTKGKKLSLSEKGGDSEVADGSFRSSYFPVDLEALESAGATASILATVKYRMSTKYGPGGGIVGSATLASKLQEE